MKEESGLIRFNSTIVFLLCLTHDPCSFLLISQNPNDKREILCDDQLKAIMSGNDKVTMFNMNKHISAHMMEKLDKTAYNYDVDQADGEDGLADEGEDTLM